MRLLTIVNDDSGLFVAQNMAQLAEGQGISTYNALLEIKENREFVSRVGADPSFDFVGDGKRLYEPAFLNNFDAIFFAKAPVGFPTFCRRTEYLDHPNRPLIIGAFPGLEFFPHRGFRNRLFCDVILFNSHSDLLVFKRVFGAFAVPKVLLVGNPTLVNRWRQWTQTGNPFNCGDQGAIFLGQSITPPRLSQRAQLLETLAREDIGVKIRQRPREGAEHVHRELFGYESISRRENIHIKSVYCTMDEALRRYSTFLSCSSTGVSEAAAAGKTVGQFATFPGWEHDLLHVASLGYTLRHDIAIDTDRISAGKRPNSVFFDDFALSINSELLSLDSEVAPFVRASRRKSGHDEWIQAMKVPALEGEMAIAYAEEGNPHKGSFLALSQLIDSNWEPSARRTLDTALGHLSGADSAFSAVDAVLNTQGSPEDLLRIQLSQIARDDRNQSTPKGRSSETANDKSLRSVLPFSPSASAEQIRRKLAKLRNHPRAFFEESRHRTLRAVGRAWFDD